LQIALRTKAQDFRKIAVCVIKFLITQTAI